MNRAQLLQLFDTLAETPGAVAKLRTFVLDLAVRGNLVPQSEKDESGAELLKSILEEKRQLTREGVIKKTPVLDSITPDSCPFKVPKNWAWAYLNDFGDWGSGATPNRSNHEFYDGTILWLKSGELNDGIVSESEEKVTELALEKCSLRLNKPGDVLLAMYGATVGKVAILGVEATTNQAVCACTCFSGVFNRYLFFLLKAFKQRFISESAGAAQPNFSKDKIIRTLAPLPPLAEQQRIVAKVEELLALCDELEARQTAAREHRTRLVRSALEHLTAAKAEPDFQKHAAFVLQHSDVVLDSVSDLRQAILALAVQGHVVPHEHGHRQMREINFEEIIEDSRYGTAKKCHYQIEGTAVLRIPNVVSGKIDLSNLKRTELTKTEQTDLSLKKGDLLVVRSNGSVSLVGRAAVVTEECVGSAFAGYLVRIRLRLAEADPEFVQLALSSSLIRQQIEMPIRTTSGVKNINTQEIYRLTFSLPPLAEQKRIVAKVDELMRWCDALEARFTAAQTAATALLNAALHKLLKEVKP